VSVALLAVLLVPADVDAQDDTFVYWGGLIFSDDANNLLVERIEAWGEENGIKNVNVI
jgi:multiple sugar transport system substrate-binding protein